jgi:hypothetical protein
MEELYLSQEVSKLEHAATYFVCKVLLILAETDPAQERHVSLDEPIHFDVLAEVLHLSFREAYGLYRPFSHQKRTLTPSWRCIRSNTVVQFSWLYFSPSAASKDATWMRIEGSPALLR